MTAAVPPTDFSTPPLDQGSSRPGGVNHSINNDSINYEIKIYNSRTVAEDYVGGSLEAPPPVQGVGQARPGGHSPAGLGGASSFSFVS